VLVAPFPISRIQLEVAECPALRLFLGEDRVQKPQGLELCGQSGGRLGVLPQKRRFIMGSVDHDVVEVLLQ
jgi:hypothetical protein